MNLTERLERSRALKREAYGERNLLIAVLASIWPAHLTPRLRNRREWAICIHTPAGNLNWNLRPEELEAFKGVKRDSEPHWDGTDQDERNSRLEALAGHRRRKP